MLLALAEKSCLATFLTKKSSARVQVLEHRTAEFVGRHAAALQIGGEPSLKGLKLAHSGLAASLTGSSLNDRPEISPEFWRERREFFFMRVCIPVSRSRSGPVPVPPPKRWPWPRPWATPSPPGYPSPPQPDPASPRPNSML